jgi:hypothetical protein
MAEWTRVYMDVSVSLSELAIINLAVYKLNEGGALPVISRETSMYASSHRFCGLYVIHNAASL